MLVRLVERHVFRMERIHDDARAELGWAELSGGLGAGLRCAPSGREWREAEWSSGSARHSQCGGEAEQARRMQWQSHSSRSDSMADEKNKKKWKHRLANQTEQSESPIFCELLHDHFTDKRHVALDVN